VKEQIEKFHETIEKKFDLIFKFYCYEKPFWYNGLVWYYTKDGKKIFWLTISVDKPPRVYFSPKIDRKTIIIKDENSFSQSLLIIKEILAKQKSKNE
jgi:hypothetical protein